MSAMFTHLTPNHEAIRYPWAGPCVVTVGHSFDLVGCLDTRANRLFGLPGALEQASSRKDKPENPT